VLFAFLGAAALAPPPAVAQITYATSEDSTAIALPIPQFVQPGDTIFIHVANGPADLVPFNNRILATVNTTRGDVETVYLFETNQDGVYTGSIQTRAGSPVGGPIPNNGTLEIRGNDTITTTALAFPAVTMIVRTFGAIKLVEISGPADALNVPGQPLPEDAGELKILTVGDRFGVRVTDDDRNQDDTVQESVQVTITSAAGDLENAVQLLETTPDSGIFVAVLPTDFQLAPVTNNGTVSVDAGADALVATYDQVTNPNGTTALPALADVRGGLNGTFAITPNPLVPNADLRVEIVDADEFADQNAGPGNDTVRVTLTSRTEAGVVIDREVFDVPEDNLTATRFLRSIPFEYTLAGAGIVNNGILTVRDDPAVAGTGTIEATYDDRLQVDGRRNVPVRANVFPLNTTFAGTAPTVTFAADLSCGGTTIARIQPGDTIFLCVRDADSDFSPVTDHVTVTLTTLAGDTERVVLTETEPRSGVFTGTIESQFADPTAPNAVKPNSGMLEVRGRDAPTPQIASAYTSRNGVAAAVANLRVNVNGRVLLVKDASASTKRLEFKAGEPLFVRVEDDDLNTNPAVIETVRVTLTSFSSVVAPPVVGPIIFAAATMVDQERNVELRETGADTGVFVTLNQPAANPFTDNFPNTPFSIVTTRFLAAGNGTLDDGNLDVRAEVALGGQTNNANTVVAEYFDPEIITTPPTTAAGQFFPRDRIFVRKGANGVITVTDRISGGAITGGNSVVVLIVGERDPALAGPAVNAGLEEDFEPGPGNDTLTVTLTSFTTNPPGASVAIDAETFVVTEDPTIEGTFRGLISSRYRGPTAGTPNNLPALENNNGVLMVVQGGSVRAEYTDPLRNNGRTNARAPVTVAEGITPAELDAIQAVLGPFTGAVTAVNSEDPILTDPAANPNAVIRRIQPGDTIYIRVDDRDLQIVPTGITNDVTVTVQTIDPVTGLPEDTEIVSLHDTTIPGFADQNPAANRAVFLGRLPTIFGDSVDGSAPPDARPGDGTLQVRGRNRIRISYFDGAAPAGGATRFNDDVNNDGALDNTLQVEIQGQARFLTSAGLIEQQGNNLFRADGRLQALKVFNSILTDALDVRAGNPVFFAVIDDDLNVDQTTPDQVAVTIASSTGDTETVTLTETLVDSGVFDLSPGSNGVRTQLNGTAAAENGIIQVAAGGAITLTYIDVTLPTPPSGPAGAVSPGVTDLMGVQDAADAILTVVESGSNDPNTVKAGNNIQITVREPLGIEPRFDPNVIDTVHVTVTSGTTPPNFDFEIVELRETDLDTSIFTGFIPTVHQVAGAQLDGVLQIGDTNPARRIINVGYTDPQPLNAGIRSPTGVLTPNTSNVLAVLGQLLTRLGADAAVTVQGTQSQSATEFILGDTVRISVSDPNLNGTAVGTITVNVTATSGDAESVPLTQVGVTGDFNNFAAPLPTTFDQSIVRGDGIMEMVGGATSAAVTQRGEVLTATHIVSLDAQGRMMRPFFATIRGFTRATVRVAIDRLSGPPPGPPAPTPNLQPPQPLFGQEVPLFTRDDTLTMFQAGDRIFLRVVDPDMNFPANNPQVPNSLNVTVTTANLINGVVPGDFEVVRLTEQVRVNGETVRGVFVGSIVTRFQAPPNTFATPANNSLELVGHDLVTVSYVDVNTTQGNPRLISTINTSTEVKTTGAITIVDSATGITVQPIVSLMPMPPNTTAFVFIRIVDKDFDSDNRPGTDAGPQITITTDTGDREVIASTESATVPGEFRAQIAIVFGRLAVPGSGRLEVVGGDLITACYTDALNIQPGFSTERCTTARVERFVGGTLEVLNPRTGLYQEPNRLEEFIIPEPLRIRVRDDDPNTTNGRDAVTVSIVTNNVTKPDQETLVLTETGNSTGVFEGEIPTAFPDIVNSPAAAAARFNNGTLTVVGGDTITITYIDAQDGTGQKNVPVVGTLTTARTYRQVLSFSNTATDSSTITLPNGARVIVPAGSLGLKQDINFELRYRTQYIDEFGKLVPPPLNPGIVLTGDSGRVSFYEIRPSTLVFKKLATVELPVPATITALGDTAMLSDADRQRLRVFYFDGFDWQSSAGQFFRDGAGREFIRAFSNHLTVFTLALDNRPPPALAGPLLSRITLDKNPFTPNKDGINDNVIIQFGLGTTATVTVRVLDANRDVVRTLLDGGTMQPGFNSLQWDGTYAFSTRTVPPGIYVIVVRATAGGTTDVQSVAVGVLR
jgi:hypothetical protein